MSEPKKNDESAPKPDAEAASAASGEPSATEKLTKEEQWARFEEELKETDWGHQPC